MNTQQQLQKPWRVVLLEDDTAMRHYLEECVKAHPGLLVMASFDSLVAATHWFDANDADIFLTDLALPDGNGIDLIKTVACSKPDCDVLVISMFGDEDTVFRCIEAGAVGYIHKDSAPADVAQTILQVKAGGSPISPMIARKILARLSQNPPPSSLKPTAVPDVVLTERESQVLDLIARGYAYAEIARLTGISINTVQTHIKKLYGKLAVHSRSEAVFEASRMGLLPRRP
jgi:DNA-binding NarL/FixJ family response regulator